MFAQQCEDWPQKTDIPKEWQNPHPAKDDLAMTLSSGVQIVFREIPIPTKSLYGDGTYRMGSSKERLFETKLDVRISSPMKGKDGRRVLYFGKYEVSKAQYVYVMGNGDPIEGLKILSAKTGDEKVKSLLARVIDEQSQCYGKLSEELKQMLAEPITYLSYVDYLEFVNIANEQCILDSSCADELRKLTTNREVAAFFRLPSEHEWEYVARRGASYANKVINEAQFQQDVPLLPDGGSLKDFAHLDKTPNRLIPIGSRKPLDDLYDIIGNAQELMQNAFTSETGYGAVGGYAARGGHYKMSAASVRVSIRSELLPFRVDDDTGRIERQKFPFSGLRLALSMPVVGSANRLGSDQLYDEFNNEYSSFETAQDRGGDTFSEAESLGLLKGSPIRVSDDLSKQDPTDFFSVELANYGKLRFASEGTLNDLLLTVYDRQQKTVYEGILSSDGSPAFMGSALLPGKYTFQLKVVSNQKKDDSSHTNGLLYVDIPDAPQSSDSKTIYTLLVDRELEADTGFDTASSKLFEDSQNVLDAGSGKNLTFQKISGFVGTGDFADVFPFKAYSDQALKLSLDRSDAPLVVRILSKNQELLIEKKFRANGGDSLSFPSPASGFGFIQIVAEENSAGTTYEFEYGAGKLVPPGFHNSASRLNGSLGLLSSKEYQGIIGGLDLEWHFAIKIFKYQNLELTLSGLTADVDMRIRNEDGQVVSNSHVVRGTGKEVFKQDLDPGTYQVRLALKDRKKVTPFTVFYTLEEPQRAKILTVAEARSAAEGLSFIGSRTLSGEVSGVKYYKIKKLYTERSRILTLGLSKFSARSDLNLYLEDDSGNILAKSENSGAQTENIEYEGEAGSDRFLRIEAVGQDPVSSYELSTKNTEGLKSIPILFKSNSSTIQDWKIGKNSDGSCGAFTNATSYSPKSAKWPFDFLPRFDVRYWPEKDGIGIILFFIQETAKPVSASGAALVGDKWRSFPLGFKEQSLSPLDKKGFVSETAIRYFSQGTEIKIKATVDSTTYEFTYSLKGYSAAQRAANALCNAKGGWMVK